MSQFTVSGRFQSRGGWRSFSKSVEAPNERVAREFAFSRFGSEHGLKRTQVRIDGVEA
ncbi:50S ribosomal protein L18Ae [Halomarina litorea]|uniref:50S ribosomal protein L18Ae n=1 Tax=Halomarina litorea TaxID=2961595 RepID=UPI0020C54A30|nr:50S ribosomal protein L18Ae [Halomarina sp. BCD28]